MNQNGNGTFRGEQHLRHASNINQSQVLESHLSPRAIAARSYFKISKCRLLFEVGLESVLFYALVLRGTQYHTSSTFHRWYVLMFTYVILFYFGVFSAGIVVYWFLGVSGEQYGALYVEESIISYKERDARISCVFILPSEFIEFVVTAEWN